MAQDRSSPSVAGPGPSVSGAEPFEPVGAADCPEAVPPAGPALPAVELLAADVLAADVLAADWLDVVDSGGLAEPAEEAEPSGKSGPGRRASSINRTGMPCRTG
jgi:hypothetical protein